MKEEIIIEKIKKLLRMKNGGSAEEIETALILAQKLAAKYNLDMNSINENVYSEHEPITRADSKLLSRLQIECKYSALLVGEFFNVETLIESGYRHHRIIFIGTATNIEIAKYIYNFIINRFRYEWNNNRGRIRNRKSFMYGMSWGLHYKLSAMQPKEHKEGLILSGYKLKIKEYVDNNFGKVKDTILGNNSSAKAAVIQGFRKGKNININKSINSNSNTKMIDR